MQKKNTRTDGNNVPKMLAEVMIPAKELRRLRSVGISIDKKLKVGKAGITEGIVNGIHERWRRSELVKIKCEDLCRMNMKRTHEILERKTGGLVIWRSGSIIILYRGANYKYPYFDRNAVDESLVPSLDNLAQGHKEDKGFVVHLRTSHGMLDTHVHQSLIKGVGSPERVRFQLPGETQLEEEADKLLDGLGPRFTDWWGYEPLPVDADLLPATVPGFRKPFRLLPYGVKSNLTNREMTILRRLSRPLPCHFALGRNRNIQGLAASMVKLWEKCEIAKIAIKRGVQNTNSELMAEELKRLIGGTVLSRDREFIVFYRGKDFLPPSISKVIEERRNNVVGQNNSLTSEKSFIGFGSVLAIEPSMENTVHEMNAQKKHVSSEGEMKNTKSAKTIGVMLSKAYEKKMKAESLLEELEKSVETLKQEPDREAISEEERYMLRKVGLRMKPFLLLGRRGVFDGTVENMHLHWKYRELVKIISKDRSIKDVHISAQALEAESGGILVAIEKVSKGHAIIVYRGKNYRRPANLRPKTLLNKKEALKCYEERQRRESLKLHVLKLSKDIEKLEYQLVKHDAEIDMSSTGQFIRSNAVSEPLTVSATAENSNHQTGIKEKGGLPISALHVPSTVLGESSLDLSQNMFKSSKLQFENGRELDVGKSFIAAPLSNKERLILRKQALKMKNRPMLSVGRNNVVGGVAKTIKTHFRKHPLAIVNIKGIAKGTSVQEVISELERATGAVLISREPSKVILYRGWEKRKEPGSVKDENGVLKTTTSLDENLPPELVTAIKIECGLQRIQEGEEL